jgi:hypothetical protein
VIDFRAPARRASVLMFVLAALMFLFAGCMGLAAGYPLDKLPPETRDMMMQLDQRLMKDAGIGIETALKVFTGMFLVPAVVMVVLAMFVRSGKRGWVVASLVLAMLLLGVLLLQMISGLSQGPGGFANLCMLLVPASLFGLLIGWLVQAYKAAGRATMTGLPPGYPPAYPQSGPYQMPQVPYGYGYGPPPGPPPQQPPSNQR